ncbi:protein zwilch homolog [Amazona ochrocephala]
MEKIKCDTEAVDSSIKSIFSERGDLDFAEQLWCKMKCVSSYQELIACFTLVLESRECGEIQPWIHHGSGSLLSKLIQQSYHGKTEAVSLTGITPVQMLLEIGLDKMKKDYVSFFIGLLHFHISRFTRTSSLCSKASPYVGNNGQLYSPTSVQTREPLPLDTNLHKVL